MTRSVTAAMGARGFDERDVRAVGHVLDLAMSPRLELLTDNHHPAYLHPGRTARVLLDDVDGVDRTVLVVAILHESCDDRLRVRTERVAESVGASEAASIESIPLPGEERMIERLLALPSDVALAALAERLDHLRHLHLRDDLTGSWAEVHDEVSRAWLPFAQRVHPVLARRYGHWTRTFANRIRGGPTRAPPSPH